MDEDIETLLIDIRAQTDGFRTDVDGLRGIVDRQLVDGLGRAGDVLERGLLSALRQGGIGFDDLRRIALRAMDDIAASALKIGIGEVTGGQSAGGIGSVLTGALTALLGLPGRATGGPVSPGRPVMVGEYGPELFVPTAAGRVETMPAAKGRDVRVSISLPRQAGADAPVALKRSARQVASFVRRAMRDA